MKRGKVFKVSSIFLVTLFLTSLITQTATAHTKVKLQTTTTGITPVTDTHQIFLPLVQGNYTPPSPYPNDPYYPNQWAMEIANAPAAWKLSHGNNILIAILDSGGDFAHIDLAGKLRNDIDKDFVNEDDEAQDDYGHGTHVAGIAAAATNNSEGVVGLGWETEILPLKVLNNRGDGSLADVIEAIYYATDHGARIINMSFSTKADYNLQCSQFPVLVEALEYAHTNGVLLIAAAGNDADDANKVIPANCPYVLTVAATNSEDTIASFSNYGDVIDIAAPGSGIYSTFLGNTYRTKSGTSMAAPFVAGLAALIWSKYPDYTPDQVTAAILNNAVDLGDSGQDSVYGCGRIDASSAVYYGANTANICSTNALHNVPVDAHQTLIPSESYSEEQIFIHADIVQ